MSGDGATLAEARPGRGDALLARFLPPGLHRLARFGMAGAASTLFYFVILNAFVLFAAVPPVVASVFSYLISLGLSYLLQSWFTFRARSHSAQQVARFAITSLVGLAVSWGLMALATAVLHWPYVVGALAVCVLIPVANYLVFKAWVFRPATEIGA